MSSESGIITALLDHVREGSAEAKDQLVGLLYDQFRSRAHQRLRHERPGHTLATADLTHEALLRLLKQDELARADNRNELFRAFARAVRQVLIDHARRRDSDKRGGGRRREELDDLHDAIELRSRCDVLALDEAIRALATQSPREAKVLTMRFFGGYEVAQIAEALGVSVSTVERDARYGLAWLRVFLSPEGKP